MGTASGIKEPPERVISAEVEEELSNYPGQWVAIQAGKVVAVADDPKSLLAKLGTDTFHGDVILHHVPQDSNAAYFF